MKNESLLKFSIPRSQPLSYAMLNMYKHTKLLPIKSSKGTKPYTNRTVNESYIPS